MMNVQESQYGNVKNLKTGDDKFRKRRKELKQPY